MQVTLPSGGTHEIVVVAVDAAGNEARLARKVRFAGKTGWANEPMPKGMHRAKEKGVLLWDTGKGVLIEMVYVPAGDFLMGDEPDAVKAGLTAAFERLLELDFDHLLLAHGEALVGDGKTQLRAFVDEQSGS